MFRSTPSIGVCGTCRLDGEACGRRIDRLVSSVTSTIGMGRGTASPGLRCDGAGASLHVCASVAFIRANGAVSGSSGCFSATGCMRECGGALELAEDGFLVSEEIAHKTIGVLFVKS